MSRLRILALSMDASVDFEARPGAKNAGIFAALAERYDIVGSVHPELPRAEDLVHKLLHVHPDRAWWRHRYNKSPLTFRRRTALAERQLKSWEGRYDLIFQLHTMVSPGDLRSGRRFVLHTDNTYALTERHYAPWAPLRGRARERWLAMERDVYQAAAFLFPRSEWLRRSFIDDYGCDPARVIRVGGGANLALNERAGRRYDQQVALFVGLQFERKGGNILLKAWERVRRKLPNARLQLVGEAPRGPVPPGVEVHGRIDDRTKLATMYGEASVFVMPSLFEPWGHVYYEAFAAGLPAIGTRCCAMPEIIDDGVTGLLVPPADDNALAEALIALLSDPARCATMGTLARDRVRTGHTWADVVDRMAPSIEQAETR